MDIPCRYFKRFFKAFFLRVALCQLDLVTLVGPFQQRTCYYSMVLFLCWFLQGSITKTHSWCVTLLHFVHLKRIKASSFSFRFLPCLCSNSSQSSTTWKMINIKNQLRLTCISCPSLIQTGGVRVLFLKINEENGKWGGGKLQSQGSLLCCSFTKILQQFTAALHISHLTTLQVCDPDWYSHRDSFN